MSASISTAQNDQQDDVSTPTSLSGVAGLVEGRLASRWWVLLVAGIAWIVLGFVVLRFDSASAAVVSVLVGVMVLLAALGELMRAGISAGGWRVWHLVLAVLLVVGAVVSFVDPGETFVSLALIIGFVFVYSGTFDIIWSLFSVRTSPMWWLQLLSGIAQLVLGFFASSSLEAGATVLFTYVSLSALSRGISEIIAAFAVRGEHPART